MNKIGAVKMKVINKKSNDNLLLGLCLLLFITPLIYFGEVRGYKGTKDFFGQIMIFILFITWIINIKEIKFRLNNLNKFVFVVSTLIIISFFFTEDYYFSFLGLKKWLSYILIYILGTLIIKDFKSVHRIFYVVVISGFIAALFGIINFYGFHFDSIIEELRGRGKVISTFGNPNYLSSFIGPVLPINFHLLLTEKKKSIRVSLFMTFAVIYTALLFARTRGVFLGLIFISGFILFTFYKYLDRGYLIKRKRIIVTVLIIIMISTAIFSGDIPFSDEEMGSLASRFEQESLLSSSNQRRIMMWSITWEMIKDAPVIGNGIGTYDYLYPHYQKEFLALKGNHDYKILAGRAAEAHNEYLQLGAESGILAAIIFIMMLMYVAYTFFKKMPYSNSQQNLLLIILGSSLLIIAIHSLVSFPLHLMQTGILFWGLLSITNNFLEMEGELVSLNKKLNIGHVRGIKIVISCFLIILVVITTSIFISNRKLAAGWYQEIDEGNLEKAKQYYQQAIKYNPYDGRSKERLGAVYSKLGWFKKAEEKFDLAKEGIISKELYNEIGMNFGRQGLHDKAIESFKKAIAFYPKQSNVYLNLGLANKMLGEKLIEENRIEAGVTRLGKSFLYLEQAKVLSEDSEQKVLNDYLTKVNDLLFDYIAKHPQLLSGIDYKFYAPENKLPIFNLIEQEQVDNQIKVRLFVYTEGNYSQLFKQQGIFNYKDNVSKKISGFEDYFIGNIRILEFKVDDLKKISKY
ncbi:MAG: O-antigen polymerase [Candidatus Frackibacter sp. T328-2]|nr:MAG: O-antigen polymerase [Candidatus Frackibacter sp. T328-2]